VLFGCTELKQSSKGEAISTEIDKVWGPPGEILPYNTETTYLSMIKPGTFIYDEDKGIVQYYCAKLNYKFTEVIKVETDFEDRHFKKIKIFYEGKRKYW
jgi:hypothetical protein